jgi:hypothetical protein
MAEQQSDIDPSSIKQVVPYSQQKSSVGTQNSSNDIDPNSIKQVVPFEGWNAKSSDKNNSAGTRVLDFAKGGAESAVQPLASISSGETSLADKFLPKSLASNFDAGNQVFQDLAKPAEGHPFQDAGKGIGDLAQWFIPGVDFEKAGSIFPSASRFINDLASSSRYVKPVVKGIEGGVRGYLQNPTPGGTALGSLSMGLGQGLSDLAKAPASIGGTPTSSMQKAGFSSPFTYADKFKAGLKSATPVIGAVAGGYAGRSRGPIGMAEGAAAGAFGGRQLDKVLPETLPFLFQHSDVLSKILAGLGEQAINSQNQQ